MRWKRTSIVIALIVFVVALGCGGYLLFRAPPSQVCFGAKCFTVEVARDEASRELGLMNRDHLDRDKGMIFVFDDDSTHSFWMKNTTIPLDMLWINSAGTVVFIARDVQPCTQDPCETISPIQKSMYVLEVNAGMSGEYGASEGSWANISLR